MQASELKVLVDLLMPCLSTAGVLPILGKLCFTKEGVYAFNDSVATIYKWDHGLGEFAVDGKALSSLINNLGDDEVQFKVDKALQVSTKTTMARLPIVGRETFVFDMPDIGQHEIAFVGESKETQTRLRELLQSIATSSISPIYAAATLATKKSSLMAYSTDGHTMIHALVGRVKSSNKQRQWVVPKLAIEQLIAFFSLSDTAVQVCLGNEVFIAEVENITLVAKLIDNESLNYHRPISFDPRATISGWKTEQLERALCLAEVMQSSYKGFCSVKIGKGSGTVYAFGAEKGSGEANITVPLTLVKGNEHNFMAKPELLKRAVKFESLDAKSQMKVGDTAVTFGNPDLFLYAVALEHRQSQESE